MSWVVLETLGVAHRNCIIFNVCNEMLQNFYHSLAAIFYAVVCWGSRGTAAGASSLKKLVSMAGSVLGK